MGVARAENSNNPEAEEALSELSTSVEELRRLLAEEEAGDDVEEAEIEDEEVEIDKDHADAVASKVATNEPSRSDRSDQRRQHQSPQVLNKGIM